MYQETFGDLLRQYRQQCKDPETGKRGISQTRFGELVSNYEGREEDYTGTTIHNWETGKDRIRNDSREVLSSVIKVLYKNSDNFSLDKANQLLISGYYGKLTDDEMRWIGLPSEPLEPRQPDAFDSNHLANALIQNLEQKFKQTLTLPANSQWPVWLIQKAFSSWTSEKVFIAIFWIIVWLLTWKFSFQILNWPFAGVEQARLRIILYTGSAFAVPFGIGGLTSTHDILFQKGTSRSKQWVLRLVTHIGAAMGFHIGFCMVFAIQWIFHLFAIGNFPDWLYAFAAVWPIILGYASAKQTPTNLIKAYGDVRLADAAPFSIFWFFSFLFGWFFFYSYAQLLDLPVGIALVLLAVGTLVGLMILQKRKTGSSILIPSIWIGIFGTVTVLEHYAETQDLLSTSMLAGLLIYLGLVLAWKHATVSLTGGVLLAASCAVLLGIWQINHFIFYLAAVLATAGWWRFGKKVLWFPATFWGLILLFTLIVFLVKQNWIGKEAAAAGILLTTLLILILEKNRDPMR